MKKSFALWVISLLLVLQSGLYGRAINPGESLWSMQRLVAQSSCDYTIRQSDFTGGVGGVLTISTSGVYCLAENCVGEIHIQANNVVFDLNSKTLTTDFAGGATNGIVVSGQNNIELRNGTIKSSQNLSGTGIFLSSGLRMSIKKIECVQFETGIYASNNSSSVFIEDCQLTGNQVGLQFDTVSRSQISNCTAADSQEMGFFLDGCTKNMITGCGARNTGQGLTSQTTDIYGFIAQDGNTNLFQNCVSQNTLATTVTGSINVAAGFAFTGTETNSEISNCTSGVVETSINGFAVPFGIQLDYTFDSLTTVTGGNQGAVARCVAWSHDGAFLAISGDGQGISDDEMQLFSFDRSTETLVSITGVSLDTWVSSISWFPDDSYIAIGANTGGAQNEIEVYSFDPVTGLLSKTDEKQQGTYCRSVAWSPDGAYLATGGTAEGSDSVQIFSFDRVSGVLTKIGGINIGGVSCQSVNWSFDGIYLALGCATGGTGEEIQVFSFDRSTGNLSFMDGKSLNNQCLSVSWSPDGTYLAAGGGGASVNQVQIFYFNRSNGQLIKTDEKAHGLPAQACFSVSWSPDGNYLATGGSQQDGQEVQIFAFDRSLGRLQKIFGANQLNCFSIAWSPDGAYLATGGSPQNLNEFQIFSAFQFPSNNVIVDNLVYGVSRASSTAAGVGISGSSIENFIVGNRAHHNDGFNYQMVPNIYDERFDAKPTKIQNISMKRSPPFYAR